MHTHIHTLIHSQKMNWKVGLEEVRENRPYETGKLHEMRENQ